MKKKYFQINKKWPNDELEHTEYCPYCSSLKRYIEYEDVKDWSFYCAPGNWNFWRCENCSSLYLNPRPNKASIVKAYAKYYTHSNGNTESFFLSFKTRLKNEVYSTFLNSKIKPNMHLAKYTPPIIKALEKAVSIPFGFEELKKITKGKFLDIGCGNGFMVDIASQLGWDSMGIEMDINAVKVGKKKNLNIKEGSYEILDEYKSYYDYIMCSHVLEHVYEPLELLSKIKNSLKPGGILLISLPNATSKIGSLFGKYWRGLEAPRHISIPSQKKLVEKLSQMGFRVENLADTNPDTLLKSQKIKKTNVNQGGLKDLTQENIKIDISKNENDFIKLRCSKVS